jgi:hypothetical protein
MTPREYRLVTLLITTHCDRGCPHCCYRISDNAALPPRHYDHAYFVDAARWLTGIERLYISGGEPTLHPEFARLALELRSLFKPRRLILATNGARVIEHQASMKFFDEIRVTYFGAPADIAAIRWLQDHLPRRLQIHSAAHLPLDKPGGGAPCGREHNAAYANGRLYPCCVAPGLLDAASIAPSATWRAELTATPLPCAVCPFSKEPA